MTQYYRPSITFKGFKNAVKAHSDWATYQHGFETHLYAIINSSAKAKASVE